MFNSLGNNNSIPNNYVYTSHRGTEYMYLDGSWLNCETMKVVEGNHNFKMNQSAIKQIAEHNEKHSLKIGKKYAINESAYTYVGRNNFTLNGNLLNENMNSNVQRLVEAASFTNFVPGDPNSTDIPNRFVLYGDTIYYKDKKQWYSNGKFIDSKQDTADLNKAAIKEIEKLNKQEDYPIGSTVDWNGQTMSWTGSNWTYPDGKRAGDKFTRNVDDFVQENPDVLKNTSKSNSDQAGSANQSSEIPKNKKITMRDGEAYYWDGESHFRNANGKALDDESNKKAIDSWNRRQSGAAPTRSMGDQGNGNSSISDPQPEQSGSSESSNTKVPNGYVYKSGKGKSYFKKNGNWFSVETKQPINSSAVQPLERAAKAQIDKFNSTSPVKIGQEWKSKKGITYKFAGDNRWISDNGKMLPQNSAQALMQQLSSQGSDEQSPSDEPEQGQEQGQNQDQAPSGNDQVPPTPNEPPAPQGSPSEEGGNDPLRGLANQIKSNPEARRIIVLISRGDEVSLLAADILLSGQQNEVAQILKSLNNED